MLNYEDDTWLIWRCGVIQLPLVCSAGGNPYWFRVEVKHAPYLLRHSSKKKRSHWNAIYLTNFHLNFHSAKSRYFNLHFDMDLVTISNRVTRSAIFLKIHLISKMIAGFFKKYFHHFPSVRNFSKTAHFWENDIEMPIFGWAWLIFLIGVQFS